MTGEKIGRIDGAIIDSIIDFLITLERKGVCLANSMVISEEISKLILRNQRFRHCILSIYRRGFEEGRNSEYEFTAPDEVREALLLHELNMIQLKIEPTKEVVEKDAT